MKSKNIKKLLFLVILTVLLIGLVSATQTNKTANTKIIKKTSQNQEKILNKPNELSKNVNKNKIIEKKKIKNNNLNQNKKTSTKYKSYNVTNYASLYKIFNDKKYYDKYGIYKDSYVNIHIKSNMNITKPITLSEGIKKLTINGHGKTISGNNKKSFLDTDEFADEINIKNIKIMNCNGSAIYHASNKLNIENSVFANNTAYVGGAIYNNGALSLTNCTFINNTAKDNSGAIDNDGTLKIDKSLFINNKAQKEGGAIKQQYHNSLNITNSVFKNNQAQKGGAIYYSGNKTLIEKNIFENNTAKKGSALYLKYDYYTEIEPIDTDGLVVDDLVEYSGPVKSTDYPCGYNIIKNNTFKQNRAKGTSPIEDYANKTVIKNNKNYKSSKYNSTIYLEKGLIKNSITNNIFIDKTKTQISFKLNKKVICKGNKVKTTITLKDIENNTLKNQKIKLKIGKDTFTLKTNNKGIATKYYVFNKTGTITITVKYTETDYYNKSNYTSSIKVKVKK